MQTLCRSYERWRGLAEAGRLLATVLGKSQSQSHLRLQAQPTVQNNYLPPSHSKKPRKSTPIKPKSRGDWILLKRIEADLSRENVAQKMGVCDLTVRAWESGESAPTDAQWQQLKEVLGAI